MSDAADSITASARLHSGRFGAGGPSPRDYQLDPTVSPTESAARPGAFPKGDLRAERVTPEARGARECVKNRSPAGLVWQSSVLRFVRQYAQCRALVRGSCLVWRCRCVRCGPTGSLVEGKWRQGPGREDHSSGSDAIFRSCEIPQCRSVRSGLQSAAGEMGWGLCLGAIGGQCWYARCGFRHATGEVRRAWGGASWADTLGQGWCVQAEGRGGVFVHVRASCASHFMGGRIR